MNHGIGTASRYLVRIRTPYSWGSGFVFDPGGDSGVCGIATTARVLQPARIRDDVIHVEHWHSGAWRAISQRERAVYVDERRQTATLFLERGELPLSDLALPMIDSTSRLKTGVEVAWLGFPRLKSDYLFSNDGAVIGRMRGLKRYYVRADTLLGSQGGPAIYGQGDSIKILGVVHGYVGDVGMKKAFQRFGPVTCIGQLHRLPGPFESIEEAKAGESPLGAGPVGQEVDPAANPRTGRQENTVSACLVRTRERSPL